jgi:hypothetical protein
MLTPSTTTFKAFLRLDLQGSSESCSCFVGFSGSTRVTRRGVPLELVRGMREIGEVVGEQELEELEDLEIEDGRRELMVDVAVFAELEGESEPVRAKTRTLKAALLRRK